MPAIQRYPAPHEQLLELAKAARRRGLTFDHFWNEAVRPGVTPAITTKTPDEDRPPFAIVWPRDYSDRMVALNALNSCRDTWKRAYENAPPTRREMALSSLRA